VDKNIAPRAYAYLVILEGEGTLAVLLNEARREANQLLARAVEAFKQHADLNIRERRKSGGSGGDVAAFWNSHLDFVIGEAAGFQDYLWGFGIRHAFTSGHLAAQAILNDQDWQRAADHEIRPLVHASLVNRWLYDRTPNRGYALLMHYFARTPDLHALMRRWYHPRRIHRLLWPLVFRHYQRLVEARASHEQYKGRTRMAYR
jgi:flavin-dependent dehydrogenase